MHLTVIFLLVSLVATAFAHGSLEARREFLATHTNNLNHCTSINRASGLEQRAIKRREKLADQLLAKRNLQSMGNYLNLIPIQENILKRFQGIKYPLLTRHIYQTSRITHQPP